VAQDERRKRPDLDRVGPIRDFSTIFGPPTAHQNGRPQGPSDRGAWPGADGVGRGVSLGYQVIDDYIRQGQEFARAMSSGAGGPGGAPFAPFGDMSDPQSMGGRLIQIAAEFANVWMDLVQTAGRGAGQRPEPRPGVPGFDINPAPPAAEPPAAPATTASRAAPAPAAATADDARGTTAARAPVTLQVEAKRPVQIAIDVKPGPQGAGLVAHALRAIDPALPRIDGVGIERLDGEDGLLVRLRVPDDQPPGVYSGIIVDDKTNLPRGTLSVRVLEPDGARTPR
jgi:hypothetical protein